VPLSQQTRNPLQWIASEGCGVASANAAAMRAIVKAMSFVRTMEPPLSAGEAKKPPLNKGASRGRFEVLVLL